MKKNVFLIASLLVTGSAFATTDHYVLRDGNHVQHLKVTNLNNETTVSADINFEPNANEAGSKSCSGEVFGEAKALSATELVLKKHSPGEATYCELKIHLSADGAKIEQSKDCDNFATGICRFSSDDKELVKVK